MSAARSVKAKAVAFIRSLEVKALTFHQRAMSGCAGEGYIDTAVKILIAVVLGALLLADRGYDTNQILAYATGAGMNVVIPSKRNCKEQRDYDPYRYRLRHLVENAFLPLKRWLGIVTRYAKNTTSFLGSVHIRCIAIWCAVLV